MSNDAKAPIGYVRGTAVIKGPNGEIKGQLEFEGPTALTEDELRRQFGLQETLDGSDSCSSDS